MTNLRNTPLLACLAAATAFCAASEPSASQDVVTIDHATADACTPGVSVSCSCPDGGIGFQQCVDGGLQACVCHTPPPPRCGDGLCNGDETCTSCHEDCGDCPRCDLAPSCSGATGAPAHPLHRSDLDVGVALSGGDGGDDGGGTDAAVDASGSGSDCGDAQLRLRLSSVTVASGGGQIYCIVSATDGMTSEVAITTETPSLGNGQTAYWDPTIAIFWGQQGLHPTSDNLTITYDCFKVGSDSWSLVLNALSSASMSAAGVAGIYGWAFAAAGVGASAAAAGAAAASGDDHRFNAQQTIDRSNFLDLTNGRTWNVRAHGSCGLFCTWDWTLSVEAWGCANVVPRPQG